MLHFEFIFSINSPNGEWHLRIFVYTKIRRADYLFLFIHSIASIINFKISRLLRLYITLFSLVLKDTISKSRSNLRCFEIVLSSFNGARLTPHLSRSAGYAF